ncbi:origin recognition complex subunit 4 C-terminus-domain-containing protein [Mycena epipterygia]|nr:origin recognition complex subunit 4 C-terminus-domain-containing protein [Mycena epipterygia]
MVKSEDSEDDIPTPPPSPTKRRRVTKPSPAKPSPDDIPTPPPSSTKGRRVTRYSPAKPSLDDIPTPPPSPTKGRRVTKPSPAQPSPAKRRSLRNRSPSPVPDSESESLDSPPPVASSSHRASPSPSALRVEGSPLASEISIPHVSANNLSDLTSHHWLNAQKREILRVVHNPPDPVDEEEDSANRIALKQLSDLLAGTVVRGEGNSCLFLGPRGSGKSRIVDQCISGLSDRPIVLRLCGWSQQTDRLAMREIAYQLSQQTGKSFLTAEDDEAADAEQPNEEPNPFLDTHNPVTMSLPPATHLPALISLLPTLSRPTIVILDAFDLFAQHPRQSLLYCLLDTVQSCRAGAGSKGIAVIGMTTRVDTLNLLEKRVKSRFSGRMLRTAPPPQSQDWVALTRGILCSRIKNPGELDEINDWQQQWEAGVMSFLEDEATITVLNETFSVTKDVRVLARLLTSVALQLSPSSPFPTSSQLVSAAAIQRSRPRFSMLHSLPYPSICLLIACVHAETAGHPTFTFEMLYEKVRDQIRISTSAPVEFNGGSIGMPRCPRPVLMSAFESLVSARIVTPTAGPSGSVAKEFVKFRAVVGRDDVKKAVQTKNDINLNKWLNKAT